MLNYYFPKEFAEFINSPMSHMGELYQFLCSPLGITEKVNESSILTELIKV